MKIGHPKQLLVNEVKLTKTLTTKRFRRLLLPTPESPITIILKKCHYTKKLGILLLLDRIERNVIVSLALYRSIIKREKTKTDAHT